jgi:hypothetical protein
MRGKGISLTRRCAVFTRNRVYHGVTGMDSFAPWLERIEKQMTERPG